LVPVVLMKPSGDPDGFFYGMLLNSSFHSKPLFLIHNHRVMNKLESALKKYLDLFADQEMYFVNDQKNLDLLRVSLFHSVPIDDLPFTLLKKQILGQWILA